MNYDIREVVVWLLSGLGHALPIWPQSRICAKLLLFCSSIVNYYISVKYELTQKSSF